MLLVAKTYQGSSPQVDSYDAEADEDVVVDVFSNRLQLAAVAVARSAADLAGAGLLLELLLLDRDSCISSSSLSPPPPRRSFFPLLYSSSSSDIYARGERRNEEEGGTGCTSIGRESMREISNATHFSKRSDYEPLIEGREETNCFPPMLSSLTSPLATQSPFFGATFPDASVFQNSSLLP